MAMYPNMMHPIPFVKHKSKHPPVNEQEKAQMNQTNNVKNENNVNETKKEENIQMQEENK